MDCLIGLRGTRSTILRQQLFSNDIFLTDFCFQTNLNIQTFYLPIHDGRRAKLKGKCNSFLADRVSTEELSLEQKLRHPFEHAFEYWAKQEKSFHDVESTNNLSNSQVTLRQVRLRDIIWIVFCPEPLILIQLQSLSYP